MTDWGVDAEIDGIALGEVLDSLPAEVLARSPAAVEEQARQRVVTWLEASELIDPTPYIIAGEFVLTTGAQFLECEDPARVMQEYVDRLVAAHVCALGFGLQPYFDAVPPELALAAERSGLLLVEIPESVPFAFIGMHVATLLEKKNLRTLREISEITKALLRASLSEESHERVIRTLAERASLNVVLLSDSRQVWAAEGDAPPPRHDLLAPLIDRLFEGQGPRVEMGHIDHPGYRIVNLHPLRDHDDFTVGALLIGTERPLSRVQAQLVEVTVTLLEAPERQRERGSDILGSLSTALLLDYPRSASDQAVAPSEQPPAVHELLGECVSASRDDAFRVVMGVPRRPDRVGRAHSQSRTRRQWRRLLGTQLISGDRDRVWAVARSSVTPTVFRELEEDGWALIVSDAVPAAGLAGAFDEVLAFEARVRRTGRSELLDETVWHVPDLLGDAVGSVLAARLLAPLIDEHADDGGSDEKRRLLLAVLERWLLEHGNWDATARALSLHRNTVRRHMQAVERSLGVDLQNARVRADLLVALEFLRAARGEVGVAEPS